MVFSSTVFLLLFFPIVMLVYYNPVWKGRNFRNIVLLLFSIVFYAWGEPVFIFIMLASVVVNWFLALGMARFQKYARLYMLGAVTLDLGVLFLFKYLMFVTENLNFLSHGRIAVLSIALPIGISFYTFQMLSYIFDVYYGKVSVQKNLLKVALYICMFPQLIAGPIVRYETVAKEITQREESWNNIKNGFGRFVFGLAKKVILANYFGLAADNIFGMAQGDVSAATAWLGAISYTLQIYFDFSAYSDMAIGLGLIFGFHFNENFNYPYISSSVTEFWRRWHISLSSWFRDYVYIPLGGSRVSGAKHLRNLFIVWLLTGIWHGANWTFIVWGLLYFVILVLEKRTGFYRHLGKFSHVYTLFVVIIAWVIFRSASLYEAGAYLGMMFGMQGNALIDGVFLEYISQTKWLLLAGVLFSMPVVRWVGERIQKQYLKEVLRAAGVLILFGISFVLLVKATYNPFIYFNF